MAKSDDSRLEIHFLVPSKDAGAIIGKEGRNIRQIRDESGANVNVAGDGSVERVVNVSGSIQNIKLATRMVASKLMELSGAENSVTVKLLIPQSQCGPIIGRGGERIKEIRETSGATINIPNESLPGSTERSVTVSGSPEVVEICVSKICEVLEEFPPRNNRPYHPGLMNAGSGPMMNMMSGQMSFSGLSRRTEQRVTLPSNVIGALIGKGGCHINEIRQFSGATVRIEEAKGNSRRSTIALSGTPEAVSCATFLINARISASKQAANRAGGDNNDRGRNRERRQRNDDY